MMLDKNLSFLTGLVNINSARQVEFTECKPSNTGVRSTHQRKSISFYFYSASLISDELCFGVL